MIIPPPCWIVGATDNAGLEEVYNTMRNFLFGTCTRTRDLLLVADVKPASEFLDDMRL